MQRLYHAPSWLNGAFDSIVGSAMQRFSDWTRLLIIQRRPLAIPLPVPVPSARLRVLVAPTNYAGQGHAWAQAISSHIADAEAVNLTIEFPGGLRFPTDRAVPHDVNRYSRVWQDREVAHVLDSFTHLLVEAEVPIFGLRFGYDIEAEKDFFRSHGLSVAFICHGSDIRSPRHHMETTEFSPFFDNDTYVDRIQRRVDRNFALLERSAAPVFVSTPDLVGDYPHGIWVPVVVDPTHWSPTIRESSSRVDEVERPLVLHTPSKSSIKGSHLIRGAVERLAEEGVIRYKEVSGVPSAQVRDEVLRADIVLDQFRLGSYGVAACESMAAGKVVLGHVTERVRAFVVEHTGLELPILEATPETIYTVLKDLVGDHERMAEIAAAGQHFVGVVHDGAMSATMLQHHWIRSE
ncbi:hypothetical protein [Microbacterium murale]|nr:hypothetical protein [Microbacterium murale]